MSNQNLTRSSLEALESVVDVVEVIKNSKYNADYINVITKTGNKVSFWTNTWSGEDIEELTTIIAMYYGGEITLQALQAYDTSKAKADGDDECIRRYVKESYQKGKQELMQIFESAMENFSYSIDFLNTVESFSFNKTSAILYKGRYITPSMLDVVAREYMRITENKVNKSKVSNYVNDFIKAIA